jgi:hypothetical protein
LSSPSREKRINIPLLPDTPNPARRIPVIARKARKGSNRESVIARKARKDSNRESVIARKARKGRRGNPVGIVVRDAKVSAGLPRHSVARNDRERCGMDVLRRATLCKASKRESVIARKARKGPTRRSSRRRSPGCQSVRLDCHATSWLAMTGGGDAWCYVAPLSARPVKENLSSRGRPARADAAIQSGS